MNLMATLASIVAIGCSLLLVSQHSGLRELGVARFIRLALIWGVLIVGLVLVIQVFGSPA